MVYTKEQAKKEIQKLVENFKNNEKELEKAPEAQIENNYIKPLFRFLNWNVENTGLSPNDQEFVVQNIIKATGKRPDYLLRLNGQSILFMDAKAVKYDMHDHKLLNQIYAYGYSTQNNQQSRRVDFAILTDFQEFVVLDCTLYAKNPEIVNRFRILDWQYSDYVSKFDELWSLFERNNVLEALKTRNSETRTGLWAKYLTPQRVNANRIAPDMAFLSFLDDPKTGWRIILAKDIKKYNPDADGELITTSVQLLIDRIVFMKVLADREIEDDYLDVLFKYLSEKHKEGEGFNKFRQISVELNEKYNGSVFEERKELNAISLSNDILLKISKSLLLENTSYNFSELPIEILGTIYERFLGKVIRTTDHQVKIDDKPEVRHAGGVYYTPQYIVDYIVENTLGKLLKKCKSPKDVEKIKVLDPACGSGSFLLSAYSKLVDWYKQYYLFNPQKSRCHVYCDDGKIRLKAGVKQKILLDNIYGVDIDAQAVEVTKLSLSLKMLENLFNDELKNEQTDLFNRKVLPNLNENIKCGNSVIALDCEETNSKEIINQFEWTKEFENIFLNSGGFNVVIGNPPYIDSECLTKYKPITRNYCTRKYESARGNWDIFCVFIERAISLCCKDGVSSYIVPNKLFSADYASALRKWINKNCSIVNIRDYSDVRVFPVNIYPIIYIAHKNIKHNTELLFEKMKPDIEIATVKDIKKIKWRDIVRLDGDNWSLVFGDSISLIEKIQKKSKVLEKIADVSGAATVSEAYDILPLIKESDGCFAQKFKLINTGTIDRYSNLWGTKKTKYLKQTYIKPIVIYSSLKKLFNKRFDEAKNEKIIIGGMTKRLECVYDNGKCLAGKSTSIITNSSIDIFYLLALLNSKLISYYYKTAFSGLSLQGGFLRVGPPQLKKIPIFLADTKKSLEIIKLSQKNIQLNGNLINTVIKNEQEILTRQIEATDKEIDRLVYELYGLTKEEIEIVEKEVGS